MTLILSFAFAVFGPIAENSDVFVTRNDRLFLPLGLNGEVRANCKGYRLWVSRDRGSTWVLHDALGEDGKGFLVMPPKDGCYWFALQLVQRDGRLEPRRIEKRENASLKVYVNRENRIVARDVRDLKSLAEQAQERIETIIKLFGS